MAKSAWFESVAEAQRRAKKRLPKSVYSALLAGSEDLATMIGLPERFSEPQTVLQYDPAAWKCAKTATGAAPVWGAPKQTPHIAPTHMGRRAPGCWLCRPARE